MTCKPPILGGVSNGGTKPLKPVILASPESAPESMGMLSVMDRPITSMLLNEWDARLSFDVGGVAKPPTLSVAQHREPPSYPPSEVRKFLVCPMFRHYSKKWEPRAQGWTPHQLVGTAIHAAISSFLQQGKTPIQAGLDALRAGYVPQETWGLDGLEALVKKGFMCWQDTMADYLSAARVLAVEYPDPVQDPRVASDGRIYRVLDAILEHNGRAALWDWKTHINLDLRYEAEVIRAAAHSWQLLDYAWHSASWGQPVDTAQQGHIILGPKTRFLVASCPISEERLTQWRQDALTLWQQMRWQDVGEIPRWHNWEACSDRHLHFGKECEFVPGCHQLMGNESLFQGVYQLRKEDEGNEDGHD